MITIKQKIGNQVIECQFQKMSEVHKHNATYGSLPKKCDACGSDDIYLSHKSPQGNDYYMVECGTCGASANFGIHKDGKGLFWKRDKMQVYKKDDNGQQPRPQQSNSDFEAGTFTNNEPDGF